MAFDLPCNNNFSFFQDMPKPLQPNFVLDVEASELFIQAGLQDRVIQVSPETTSLHIYMIVYTCTCIHLFGMC